MLTPSRRSDSMRLITGLAGLFSYADPQRACGEASPMTRGALSRPRGCRRLFVPAILAVAIWAPSACAEDVQNSTGKVGPVFSDSGPDAELYGAAAGYPVGTRGTTTQLDKLVGVYTHFGEIYPSRPIL